MAFKCGHCGEKHDRASEARECADKKRQPIELKDAIDARSAESEVMRPAAQKFLADLLRQFGIKLAGGMTPETIPWQDGKKVLHGLIDARRLKATGQEYTLPDGIVHDPKAKTHQGGERRPTRKPLPACPPGYYCVPDWTGKEEFKFFWVKIKKKGRYAGETFIDEVIGGQASKQLGGKYAVDAIKAILDFDPELAGILFADKLKHCHKCNRHLTKKASRIIKMGRDCAYRNDRGQEWDDLNATFGDAEAEDDD